MLRMVGATTRPAPDGSPMDDHWPRYLGLLLDAIRPEAATPLPAEPWRLKRARRARATGARSAVAFSGRRQLACTRQIRTAQSAIPEARWPRGPVTNQAAKRSRMRAPLYRSPPLSWLPTSAPPPPSSPNHAYAWRPRSAPARSSAA